MLVFFIINILSLFGCIKNFYRNLFFVISNGLVILNGSLLFVISFTIMRCGLTADILFFTTVLLINFFSLIVCYKILNASVSQTRFFIFLFVNILNFVVILPAFLSYVLLSLSTTPAEISSNTFSVFSIFTIIFIDSLVCYKIFNTKESRAISFIFFTFLNFVVILTLSLTFLLIYLAKNLCIECVAINILVFILFYLYFFNPINREFNR
jgi:hypothetical protein